MADKQIKELPDLKQVTSDTLIPVYQPGSVSPAQKMNGAQFRAFAETAGANAGAEAGQQAAAGLSQGATFTPHFDPATGMLSWTNEFGLPNPDPVQLSGVTAFHGRSGAVVPQKGDYSADMVGAVPVTRTINGIPLDKDIEISTGSVASVNEKTGDVVLSATDVGAVPITRKVNGLELNEDITIPTGVTMELLWENASPTSEFAAQTISVDTSGYEFFLIRYRISTGSAIRADFLISKDGTYRTFIAGGSSANGGIAYNIARDITITDSSIAFTVGSANAIDAAAVVIPIKIYGIKGVQA